MPDETRPANENSIACATCLKEIPASEAVVAEAQDYVRHFCGLECYQVWQERAARPGGDESR